MHVCISAAATAVVLSAGLATSGCSRPDHVAAGDTIVGRGDSIRPAIAGARMPAGDPASSPWLTRPSLKTAIKVSDAGATTSAGATDGRPHLSRLVPSSAAIAGGAVVVVALSGTGLTDTKNRIFFGAFELGAVDSDGRTLRFSVPTAAPSRGEAAPMELQPGRYPVYVVNRNGTSDTLTFTLRNQLP